MQNNPNQEIHTDYRANDIFKPINANRLAESIHYDFVITQEMWDKYIENYPDEREIDVGVLLCCNSDGTKGQSSQLAKAPVSVYIAAKIPLTHTLNFTGAFANVVVDCSDFKSNGAWSATLTRDMIDIYSAHPYAVTAIAGGFNFWSNPVAYVQLNGNNLWDGICKIGSYKLTQATNLLKPDSFQLVIEGHNEGTYSFTYNFNDDTPYEYAGEARPSVVYANWMTGGGISTQYSISGQDMSSPTTIKNGLFAQMRASMTEYDTEPVLVVGHNYASARYTFCGWNSYYLRFANTDEGKAVDVYKDGRVLWKDVSGGSSGGGSSDIILFQDDGVMIPYKTGRKFVAITTEMVASSTSVRYSLFQNGQFTKYSNDGNVPLFKTPYNGGGETYGLRPYGTNHIVWNTWYAIKEYSTFEGDDASTPAYVKTIVNGSSRSITTGNNALSTMVIVTDALVEGLVYEMTINIRAIATTTQSETGSTAPGGEEYGCMYAPSRYNQHFGLAFYTETGASITPKRWADTSQSAYYILCPRFNPVPSADEGTGYGPGAGSGIQAPVLATAKVYFVKVGSDIFVMAY